MQLLAPCIFLTLVSCSPAEPQTAQSQGSLIYKDSKQTVEARVQDLLVRMTLEEKLQQLRSEGTQAVYEKSLKTTGLGFFPIYGLRNLTPDQLAAKIKYVQALAGQSRLGIPTMPYEEALHGLITKGHTSYPQAIGLAATWDPDFVNKVAQAIAKETKAQGIRQVLSPVINVCRDARWGRVEESYGEDTLITSRMGVAFVKAFEQNGIVTTPKHYVANIGDGGRDSHSVHISQRQLFEIYMEPFEACFKEGGSRSVMCSYNALNGVPCASDPWLLTEVLRGQWGFKGYVVSDWGAANHVWDTFHQGATQEEGAALLLNAGMDVEHPGTFMFGKSLEDALKSGKVEMQTLDESVARVLRMKFEIGLFDEAPIDVPAAVASSNAADNRALALEAARKSMVLLKNQNKALPLSKSIKKIAVFGDLANDPIPLGGYSGDPGKRQSVVEALAAKLPATKIDFRRGCQITEFVTLPLIPASALQTADGKPGLAAEYWKNNELKGKPDATLVSPTIDFDWKTSGRETGQPDNFSMRWKGNLVAPESGTYQISVTADDGVRLYINNKLMAEDWSDHPATTLIAKVTLRKGVPTPIRIDYFEHWGEASLKLGWSLQKADTYIADVKRASEQAEVSLVFVGIREGENSDRAYLDLPGNQEAVILAAAESGKPVIVVLVAGAPVTMDKWLDQVPAVLEAWFPGQEGAQAIVEALFGEHNPGGKLPMTFPKTVGQCPLYYNMETSGRAYDYVDSTGKPLFPFGHGLSYTTFEYSPLKVTGTGPFTVSLDVTNTGAVAGDEVVQLYIRDDVASLLRPLKELKGFQRISLSPGEKRTLSFTLGFKELSMYDLEMKRIVEPGAFEVMVGSSCEDIRSRAKVTVSEAFVTG